MARKAAAKVEEEDVYEIKSILQYENRRGTDYYLVEWDGYPLSDATWEPRSNFFNPTPEILSRLNELKLASQGKHKRGEGAVSSLSSDNAKPAASGTRKSVNGVTVQNAYPSASTTGRSRRAADTVPEKSGLNEKRRVAPIARDVKRKRKSGAENDHSSRCTQTTMDHYVDPESQGGAVEDIDDEQDEIVAMSKQRLDEVPEHLERRLQPGEENLPTAISKRDRQGRQREFHDLTTPKNESTLFASTSPSDRAKAGKAHSTHDKNLPSTTSTPTRHGTLFGATSGAHQPLAGTTSVDGTSASAISTGLLGDPVGSNKVKDHFLSQSVASTSPESSGVTVRVKALRQDSTHGLCGIITIMSPTGDVEEARIPVSDIRKRYPDELIEFLLLRIQFRSVRTSSGGTNVSTAPAVPATASPTTETNNHSRD